MSKRFNRTMKQELFAVAMPKRLYRDSEELEEDLEEWLPCYNETRPHSDKYCYGKTLLQTFGDSKSLA